MPMYSNINEQILQEEKIWVDCVLKNYVITNGLETNKKGYEGTKLSHPFYMGLSNAYIKNPQNRKRIMVVGQEAKGYGWLNDGSAEYNFISCEEKKSAKNKAENSQKWAIAYYEWQLKNLLAIKNVELPSCYNEFTEHDNNPSPFWNFMRKLYEADFMPCWNNLDKVYYSYYKTDEDEKERKTYKDKKGVLTVEGESALSVQYPKIGDKSLLQREIELAQPDAVVFVVGRSYHASIETAFNLSNNPRYTLKKYSPNINNILSDITSVANISIRGKSIPAFWTYHPRYMNINKSIGIANVIEQLSKLINK